MKIKRLRSASKLNAVRKIKTNNPIAWYREIIPSSL